MVPTIIAVGAAAFVLFMVMRARVTSEFIDGAKARSLVEGGAVLLDVRSPAEFADGHVDGAKNIPHDEVAARTSEVGSTDTTVVVYCRSGIRSSRAKAALESAGFTDVHNLGGMDRW